MEQIMKYEQNPLNNNWLCWIPDTPQAYYCNTKTQAVKFCDNVNTAFKNGALKIINGKVTKIK